MNPWRDKDDPSHEAPYRVALGGIKGVVARNRLATKNLQPAADVPTSIELMRRVEELVDLKTSTLERVRELERLEATVATSGILLPSQLEAKIDAIRSLQTDLESLLEMKSVLLRTLQKNITSEYVDIEMKHQRTFIDLFLKLSDELPRHASALTATPIGAVSTSSMTEQLRARQKEYEAAVHECKSTIAQFHLIQDTMARLRSAYSQVEAATVTEADDSSFQ